MSLPYHLILVYDAFRSIDLCAIRPTHSRPQPERGAFGGPVRPVIQDHELDTFPHSVFLASHGLRLACAKLLYVPGDIMYHIQELRGICCLSRHENCQWKLSVTS